jgi:hypothetical protein
MKATLKDAFWAVGLSVLLVGGGLWILSLPDRRKNPDDGPLVIACLGDSLTTPRGYCATVGSLYPLGAKVYAFGYPNQGVGAIEEHLDSALAVNPTDLIILAGVNDLASGRPLSDTKAALARMYNTASTAGVRVVAVTLTPWGSHRSGSKLQAATEELNSWIRSSGYTPVDTAPLGTYDGALLQQFDSGDGLHLNVAGHRELGRQIYLQAFTR